jgi:2-methylisocitrate lyase-like PEP mutase family enzyme
MAPSLRQQLRRGQILLAPGAYDAFSARLIERAGFACVFMSGAGISYTRLAESDVGLVNQSEMADAVATLRRGTALPLICDADNGYGNAMNVMRTVQLFETAGANAIQLEDQAFPKRCGHMTGKKLIGKEEMVLKIKAALAARRHPDTLIIARTDARTVEGLDRAIDRARAYQEAGADVLFVEAPLDRAELLEVTRALPGIPHVVNMVEGGKTPPFPASELESFGYHIALFPNTLLRLFARVGEAALHELREQGGTAQQAPRMLSFDELNEMLGIQAFTQRENQFVPKD